MLLVTINIFLFFEAVPRDKMPSNPLLYPEICHSPKHE